MDRLLAPALGAAFLAVASLCGVVWLQAERLDALASENAELTTQLKAVKVSREIENEVQNLDDAARIECLSGPEC